MIKPSYGDYETIYSGRFYKNNFTGSWFVKLEGDNIQKVQAGDNLIVKADSNGPTYKQPKTKVVSSGVKEENFLNSTDATGIVEPSGVYMEINQGNFTVETDINSTITYGDLYKESRLFTPYSLPITRQEIVIPNIEDTTVNYWRSDIVTNTVNTNGPALAYPVHINTGTLAAPVYENYEIPAGAEVDFFIESMEKVTLFQRILNC